MLSLTSLALGARLIRISLTGLLSRQGWCYARPTQICQPALCRTLGKAGNRGGSRSGSGKMAEAG